MTVPTLAGIHHLKLPVRDMQRSADWYREVLGYRVVTEFVEQGKLAGLGMEHPDGGPPLALRLNPELAQAAAGFDYFAIGVPDLPCITALAARLDEIGLRHGGVHRASEGWILPMLQDPDGHEVRFYTHARHEDAPTGPHRVHDPGPNMRVEPLV